jgi:hypothetical protein
MADTCALEAHAARIASSTLAFSTMGVCKALSEYTEYY